MLILHKMANEMHYALKISYNIACLHENSRPQIWHPHLSWTWLGVAPRTFILDERSTAVTEDIYDAETYLSQEETRQGLAENCGASSIPHANVSLSIPITEKGSGVGHQYTYSFIIRQIRLLIPRLWRCRAVIGFRIRLSRIIRSIQHSSHLRHALKNAAGVALLSIPAFLPANSAG